MTKQRETSIDVDAHLKDPAMEKVRRELAQTVRRAHAEMDERNGEVSSRESHEEEDYLPSPEMMSNTGERRGTLNSRMQEDFKRRAEATPIPPPPRYRKLEGQDGAKRPLRQNFNPDIGEHEENETIADDDGYITNKPSGRFGSQAGPVPAPEISEIQRLDKRLKDLEEGKNTNISDGKKAPGRLAARRKSYSSEYQTVSPPSQCNFYQHFAPNGLEIKKIDVPTQQLITEAKQLRDMSKFIDAVGSTLRDVDIRDITPEDWFYILYWHKYNSYNKTPLILTWESKYGNENQYVIQETDLRYVFPSITQEEYVRDYYNKGLIMPTMREWELLNTDTDLNQEDKDILIRAQYFKGDTLEEKVDNYFATGETLEMLELVEELKTKAHHGVVHTVDVVDAKFDPSEYAKNRKEYMASLHNDANMHKDTPALYRAFMQEAEIVEAEITVIEETLKNGGQVRAEVETQPVRFNALDMFPFL